MAGTPSRRGSANKALKFLLVFLYPCTHTHPLTAVLDTGTAVWTAHTHTLTAVLATGTAVNPHSTHYPGPCT